MPHLRGAGTWPLHGEGLAIALREFGQSPLDASADRFAVSLPHASGTLGVREVCRLARCGSPPPVAPIEHQGVLQNAIDRPMGSLRAAQGAGELGAEADGTLFPSLCFPPSVSLYGFLP